MQDAHALLKKIQALPPGRIAEAEDFVEFVAAKTRRQAAIGRLLKIAPAPEAAGVPPITEDEIQAEIGALRAARRARRPSGAPSPETHDWPCTLARSVELADDFALAVTCGSEM